MGLKTIRNQSKKFAPFQPFNTEFSVKVNFRCLFYSDIYLNYFIRNFYRHYIMEETKGWGFNHCCLYFHFT